MEHNDDMCNPRYTAYARAHDKSPDEMLSHDKNEWPGGCMVGFMLWIGEQKKAFRDQSPEAFYVDVERNVTLNIVDQKAWDRFLQIGN